MNDRHQAGRNVPTSRPLPQDRSFAPQLGLGSGNDFVARLDLDKAAARFSAMLETSADTPMEAEEARECYEVLNAEWNASDPDAELITSGKCEIFEVCGAISYFDVTKGYGFIVPDNGSPEAVLHAATLRASGFPAAPTGASVACQVVKSPSGLRVHRVLTMRLPTRSSKAPSDEPYPAEAQSCWEIAAVKWFNPIRGFGYLSVQSQRQLIYCQIETLRRFGFFELRPGQLVEIRWGQTAKGCTVADMRFSQDGLL